MATTVTMYSKLDSVKLVEYENIDLPDNYFKSKRDAGYFVFFGNSLSEEQIGQLLT
jgi:hypothetical protein